MKARPIISSKSVKIYIYLVDWRWSSRIFTSFSLLFILPRVDVDVWNEHLGLFTIFHLKYPITSNYWNKYIFELAFSGLFYLCTSLVLIYNTAWALYSLGTSFQNAQKVSCVEYMKRIKPGLSQQSAIIHAVAADINQYKKRRQKAPSFLPSFLPALWNSISCYHNSWLYCN